jgi:hypothetical protein
MTEILSPRQHASLILHVCSPHSLPPPSCTYLLFQVCHSRFFEWPYHAQVIRTAWDMVSRATNDAATITQHHPLSPPLSPSPYPSPSYEHQASPPLYMAPASPPTVVPSLAIPTPLAPFPTTYTFLPNSPSLTPTCAPQHSNPTSSLVQSFLSSLNYGVYLFPSSFLSYLMLFSYKLSLIKFRH